MCSLVTFMTFQQKAFTTPLYLYVFFYILFFSVITLQMKWLTMKRITQGWTLPLHSCRTRSWPADRCTVVKPERAYFGETPEGTCHVYTADVQTHKRKRIKRGKKGKKGDEECERDRNLAFCAVWKPSCVDVFGSQQCVDLWHLLFSLCFVPVAQAQIWWCVFWLGHGSCPESF